MYVDCSIFGAYGMTPDIDAIYNTIATGKQQYNVIINWR